MARFREAGRAVPARGSMLQSRKEQGVPLIQVKLIKGVFDQAEKREMIERLTDTMVEIEGEAMRSVTWVTIEETESGDWGVAGNALTVEDVLALRNSVPA
jgi:4-oxalocrotonate tautomerase